jgi:hypothetical protein
MKGQQKKGRVPARPDPTPCTKGVWLMILKVEPDRKGDLATLEKKGEPGTRLQASPDPRANSPQPIGQGVCR